MRITVINGPNLNLLGSRETSLYGKTSLSDLITSLQKIGTPYGVEVLAFQSNCEGEMIDFIHKHAKKTSGCILNAGAYTSTSIAIRDALLATETPFIEVHLTNIATRESYRQRSLFSDIALGSIQGMGLYGYQAALHYFIDRQKDLPLHSKTTATPHS